MNTGLARCYCGNITADVVLSKSVSSYEPRACDCDFCKRHDAAYLSDSKGKLRIRVKDDEQATYCQHGSGLADFLICKNCGVLVAVTFTSDGATVGSLNSRTLEHRDALLPQQIASPKLLSDAEKRERWKRVWFQDVQIE